jgi:hypothetical protein
VSAGLPGLGLGGLFFIFSALLAPFRELWRTWRGQSRPGDWRMAGRQFAQAVTMVAAIDLSLRLVYAGLAVTGIGNPPPALSDTVIPVTLIGITSALLVVVLAAAKLADVSARLRAGGLPQAPPALPRPTPLRALALGGAVAIAWAALLTAGASELSPLTPPPGGSLVPEPRTEAPPRTAQAPPSSGDPRRTEASAVSDIDAPRGSHVRQPPAEQGHGTAGDRLEGTVQPPTPAAAPPSASAPGLEKPTPAAASPNAGSPPASAAPANEPSPAANPPQEPALPPTAPPAHEQTGPPEHAGGPPNHPAPGPPEENFGPATHSQAASRS